jgi:hypothetical protein
VTFLFVINSVFDFLGEEIDMKSGPLKYSGGRFFRGGTAFAAGRGTATHLLETPNLSDPVRLAEISGKSRPPKNA